MGGGQVRVDIGGWDGVGNGCIEGGVPDPPVMEVGVQSGLLPPKPKHHSYLKSWWSS